MKKLGEMLIDAGVLDEPGLQKALARQKQNGKKLGEVLVEMNIVTEDALFDALAQQLTIPIIGQEDEDHPIPDPGPYNAAILALAARARLPVVDLHRAFYEVYERAGNYKQIVRLSDDGVHPNRQGHALIARALVAQLGLLRK